MKKRIQIVVASIILVAIFSCKSEKENITDGIQFLHKNDLSKKSIQYNAKDTSQIIGTSISKSYEFELEGKTEDNQELKINNNWILDFAFIDLRGKSYFVPHSIFPEGEINHHKNIEVIEDYSIDIFNPKDGNFHFEIEFCYSINQIKNNKKTQSKGITLTEKKFSYSKDIFYALSKKDNYGFLNLKPSLNKNEKDICRKIKVLQEETTVIFSEISTQNIDDMSTSNFHNLQIIESGNLLDTLKIDKSIWSNYRRLYK
jgi:hypothetical protein